MVLRAPAPLTHVCMHVCLSVHMSVFYQNFSMGMTPVPSHMILSCINIPLSESGRRHWNRLQVLFQRTSCAIIDLKKTECLHKTVDFPLPNTFLQFSHILSSISSIEMFIQQDFSGRDWFPYWLLYHGEITVFSNISCICIQNTENQLHKDRSLALLSSRRSLWDKCLHTCLHTPVRQTELHTDVIVPCGLLPQHLAWLLSLCFLPPCAHLLALCSCPGSSVSPRLLLACFTLWHAHIHTDAWIPEWRVGLLLK